MKQHAIIPIFIPHRGCPNDCVFCNQRSITARQDTVTPEDAKNTIETWLSTLEGHTPTIEVAFFGGSFTGIPMEEQTAFLKVAKAYKDAGRIHKIHLSTRPDYIDRPILDQLRRFDVDVIELGVQSFDDDVLRTSGRGHGSAVTYESSRLIQEYGFTLGIQLMIGLPGDTLEKDLYSARETVKIGPALARLYPTVILKDTALYDMYLAGVYQPMSQDDAVLRTKEMYKILDAAGIQIIRVGLKSSDLITAQAATPAASAQPEAGRRTCSHSGIHSGIHSGSHSDSHSSSRSEIGSHTEAATPAARLSTSPAGAAEPAATGTTSQVAAGTFHPAFRQLVEGEIARESLEAQIRALFPALCHANATGTGCPQSPPPAVLFVSCQKDLNNLFGHKSCNRTYFAERYPWLNIRYATDRQVGLKVPPGRYLVLPIE